MKKAHDAMMFSGDKWDILRDVLKECVTPRGRDIIKRVIENGLNVGQIPPNTTSEMRDFVRFMKYCER